MNSDSLEKCLRVLKSVKRFFLAYNANVDYIKHLDASLDFLAKPFKPKPGVVQEIRSPQELFSAILFSMQQGEAMEIGMTETMEHWLRRSIRPDEKKMGGQVGIMANHLALLGITPIVSIPFVSQEQKKLFNKKTRFLDQTVKPWKKIRKKDPLKANWVFEFSKNKPFLGQYPKRTTRFIASSRLDGFRLKPFSVHFPFDMAILSGFHAVKKRYRDGTTFHEQFELARKTALRIRKKQKPLHVELGFSPDSQINTEMLKVAALADSIGLDEQELANALETFGKKSLASKIRKTNAIKPVIQGILILKKKLQRPTIYLHGRGYYLAACKKTPFQSLERIHEALDFASVTATAYALQEVKTKKDLQKGLKIPVSRNGIQKLKEASAFLKADSKEKKAEIFCRKNYCLVLVPIRMASKPRRVVGLGDIISASIVACENALKK